MTKPLHWDCLHCFNINECLKLLQMTQPSFCKFCITSRWFPGALLCKLSLKLKPCCVTFQPPKIINYKHLFDYWCEKILGCQIIAITDVINQKEIDHIICFVVVHVWVPERQSRSSLPGSAGPRSCANVTPPGLCIKSLSPLMNSWCLWARRRCGGERAASAEELAVQGSKDAESDNELAAGKIMTACVPWNL